MHLSPSKNKNTESEFYGIFLGNYIFYVHYLLIISVIICIIHYFIFPVHKKTLFIILPVALLLIGGVGYYNYRNTIITNTNITLNKASNLEHIKIAFVADLHLTTTSNKNLFIDMVKKINSQKPDIIFFGGDILQNSYAKVTDDYKQIFSKLQSTYGVYTILGNHEYYGNDIDDNIAYLKDLGINILRDEVLQIGNIKFIARDDVRRDYTTGERKSLTDLYNENEVSLDEPIIVLDHNPQSIPESIDNKADIQLSAHTHAGQFFPYNLILRAKLPNAYGYKKIEDLHTVVTSGVGVGFWKIVGPWQMPYRLGTRSEINIIEINFN